MDGRTPRFKRKPKLAGGLTLQERDIEIIKLVHEYRFLNSKQIQALVQGSDQVILRRLRKLFHHGYLDRPVGQIIFSNPIMGPEKMVYALGDKGADLMAEWFGIDRGKVIWKEKNREVRERYIQHTLLVSKFRACLSIALRNIPNVSLLFWQRENVQEFKEYVYDTKGSRKKRLTVVPDGFFGIEDAGGRMYFFLEADRSTMTAARFLNKMQAYWLWWRQGGSRKRFGIENFRVLTLTVSKRRRDNLVKRTQGADEAGAGSYMFWFADSNDINLDAPLTILQNIWKTAAVGDERMHSLLE